MTAPNVENLSNAMTMEEIEEDLKASSTPEPVKLEGDSVPADIRGKTPEEISRQVEQLRTALQISESERLQLLQKPVSQTVVQQHQEPEYVPLTKEQIQTMYEENPLGAIEAMQNDALIRADMHFNSRFAGLETSGIEVQHERAKQTFQDEFKVLGPQIEELVRSMPDKRVFNTEKGWKDAIAYVRGQEGNFEKLWEYRTTREEPRTRESARAEQVASSGFSPRSTERSSLPSPDGDLDPTTARIADVLGIDPKEYKKWAKIGTGR